MTIHFIYTGNIYRSRLAEAYCASKSVPGLCVLSSGVGTKLNRGIHIAPYAARVLSQRGLERFAAPSWQQTTAALGIGVSRRPKQHTPGDGKSSWQAHS